MLREITHLRILILVGGHTHLPPEIIVELGDVYDAIFRGICKSIETCEQLLEEHTAWPDSRHVPGSLSGSSSCYGMGPRMSRHGPFYLTTRSIEKSPAIARVDQHEHVVSCSHHLVHPDSQDLQVDTILFVLECSSSAFQQVALRIVCHPMTAICEEEPGFRKSLQSVREIGLQEELKVL